MTDDKKQTPARPDNPKTAADPFGKPKKKPEGWTHSAMQEALREPHLDGNDDPVAEEELDAEKK
ncbi:hypothetical protein DC366_00890 [Pelagivirga sediminicola]|uniref:Uncharacterized protein n=1 Tax=Pelagivirga sediminicola TaxID=2170575 RepID=A0A2T7GAX3_9RHOB|nr:hypothetical protein [Pelagivirga sediminicola]PVA11559.1 hypothetical protein DC366_00890 [Pelagivirga sediminicola]